MNSGIEEFLDEPESFTPQFCPNPECVLHNPPDCDFRWKYTWFVRRGVKNDIQQFICKECSRCFSESTFKLSYYEKVSLDYDEILAVCDENITLDEWAFVLNTTAPTLKIRLHKLLWMIVQKLEEQIESDEFVGDLNEAIELLAECQVQYGKRKGRLYPVLRDLIFRFKKLLSEVDGDSGQAGDTEKKRLFFTDLKQNLLKIIRCLIGQWRYRMSGSLFGHFDWSPNHQLE